MRMMQAGVLVAAMAMLAMTGSQSRAQPVAERWVGLGCKNVNFNVDRDVLQVGNRDGRFTALRLIARGNNAYMLDLKVVYGNGAPDDVPVRAELRSGTASGKLDLRGSDRAIDRVEMVYRSQPNFRGKAEICVEGLAVVAGGPPGGGGGGGAAWSNFGCRSVGFRVDRDVIQVAPRPDGYRAIRLKVGGNGDFHHGSQGRLRQRLARRHLGQGADPSGHRVGPARSQGRKPPDEPYRDDLPLAPDFRGQAEVCAEGLKG